MAQFVQALDKDGDCFKYICQKFCTVICGKLKAGVFTGPQVCKLITDTFCESSMNQLERKACQSFKNIVAYFLGNRRRSD
jgi:hypothetical protein